MAAGGESILVQCTFPGKAKSVIDKIDDALGRYFGLSDNAVDFNRNYEIKYRVRATE